MYTDPNCEPELKPTPPPPPPPADEPPPTPYGERDSDGDGIKNSQDVCPNERGPRSNNGCPYSEPAPTPYGERDSDGDGIKNSQDVCPNKRETFNGYRDNDGCPDTRPTQSTESPTTSSSPENRMPSDNIVNTIIYAVIGIIVIAIIAKKLNNRRGRIIKDPPKPPVKPDDPDAKEKKYWNELPFEDKEKLCLDSGIKIKYAKKEFTKIKRENWRKLVTEIRKRESERKIKEIEKQAAQKVIDAEAAVAKAAAEAAAAEQDALNEQSEKEDAQRKLEEKKRELERAERRAAEAEANSSAGAANRDFWPPAEGDKIQLRTVQGVRKRCEEELDKDDKNSFVSDINTKGRIKIDGEPRLADTKYGFVQVCNAILDDKTGKIKVALWGECIDLIDDGGNYKIEGSWVRWYKGLRLQIGQDVKITNIGIEQKHEEARQKREKLDFLEFEKLGIYTPETEQCRQEGRYTDAKLKKLVSEFKKEGWDREDFGKKYDKQRWLLEQIIRHELYQRTFDEFTHEERQESKAKGEHYEQKAEYSYYDILEVGRYATLAEIKAKRRELVKKWHPDKHQKDPTFRDEMIKKINEAWETLSDPVKRSRYNDSL